MKNGIQRWKNAGGGTENRAWSMKKHLGLWIGDEEWQIKNRK